MKASKKYYLSFLWIGFIIGGLLGIVSINALVSYRIDIYHQQIQYLKTVIEDKDIRLKKLEESINRKKVVLKEIQIVLLSEEDVLDNLTLEKHIKQKYTELLGKEIKQIDIDILDDVVDRRIMKVDDKEYRLKVLKLVLTEILKIWIQVVENE
ncbi:hypothetical protein QBE52_12550 [Clostridiaceae bacterium 35-E11]